MKLYMTGHGDTVHHHPQPSLGALEKVISCRGVRYRLLIWPGPFPHGYDWQLRSMSGVLLAQLCCTKAGDDRNPETSARYCLRQGEPQRGCRLCQKQRREVWCELWRNGPGNRERMTPAERRQYAEMSQSAQLSPETLDSKTDF